MVLYVITLFLFQFGCSQNQSGSKETFTQSKDQEIIQITPRKPTRIQLKRTSTGKYSWDLKGEDVEEMMKIDKKLKGYMSEEKKGE
jgi:predicted secreted protein